MLKRMFRGNGADLLLAGIAMLAIGLLLPGSSVGGCVATCANGCGMCRYPCQVSDKPDVKCHCDKYTNPVEKCNTCECRRQSAMSTYCACLERQ